MQLFRFDQLAGRTIDRFDSVNAMISRIMRTPGSVQIGCIHLGEVGVVGYHPAVCPQLFLVVSGEGWVCGEDRKPIRVGPGQAAFWTTGEEHESGSETGMTAIIIEGEGLDPASFMPQMDS